MQSGTNLRCFIASAISASMCRVLRALCILVYYFNEERGFHEFPFSRSPWREPV